MNFIKEISEWHSGTIRGEILPFPPRTNTMAVRTADLPDPFSPDRKVSRWLGVKVNFYNKTSCKSSRELSGHHVGLTS